MNVISLMLPSRVKKSFYFLPATREGEKRKLQATSHEESTNFFNISHYNTIKISFVILRFIKTSLEIILLFKNFQILFASIEEIHSPATMKYFVFSVLFLRKIYKATKGFTWIFMTFNKRKNLFCHKKGRKNFSSSVSVVMKFWWNFLGKIFLAHVFSLWKSFLRTWSEVMVRDKSSLRFNSIHTTWRAQLHYTASPPIAKVNKEFVSTNCKWLP